MTPETIMLRHSQRGMDVLTPFLPQDYCRQAAKALLGANTILLTTGFYVHGYAETDGPPGAAILALALKALGKRCVILSDAYCAGFFDELGVEVRLCDHDLSPKELLEEYRPDALVSIERCGKNAQGLYQNMRYEDISPHTPPLDDLFPLASSLGILTIGIGDGGNEVGMGNLAHVIRQQLSLDPCVVKADHLIAASVSNWGAYGLVASLSVLTGQNLLMGLPWLQAYLARLCALHCVDGVSHLPATTVDGYPQGTEEEIYTAMLQWCNSYEKRSKELTFQENMI